MKLSKIVTIITAVLGLIGVVLYGRLISAGDDAIVADAAVQASVIDPYISYSKFLLILTAIIAIAFSLWSLIKNPAALKKALIALAALGVLLFIAYSFAGDEAVLDQFGRVIKDGEAGSVSKWVSTLMNYAGILGIVGVGAVLMGGLKSVIAK